MVPGTAGTDFPKMVPLINGTIFLGGSDADR